MAKLVPSVESMINRLWTKFQVELPKIGGELRPKKSNDVFSYTETASGAIATARPVCLSLKERANASSSSRLFVAVEGLIAFDPASTRDDILALDFKTRVGYFREAEPKRLIHVYGAHYDRDDGAIAHPVFHSQMSSMSKLFTAINDNFHRQFTPIAADDDLVARLLPNVRVPIAYMDLFSTLLQISGDHLLYKGSDAAAQGTFDSLRTAVGVFRSSMTASPRLDAVLGRRCFRAGHWYA